MTQNRFTSEPEDNIMVQPTCYPPVKTHAEKPAPNVRYVKYVPVGFVETHSIAIGYLLWVIGFTGAHRFYYGRPLTGVLWFFTLGLLGVGWLIDAFLIPSMNREADSRYCPGAIDYNLAWVLLVFLGWSGLHRFYQGKIVTGAIFFLTGGLFGVGLIYDVLTLNEQISERNEFRQPVWGQQSAGFYAPSAH